ncbi:DUF1524 domain-containing protein [Propionivibrio sp.]|uniref:GmrSD restriction endonuclease domain-containing protein n=1 Tax=Propionivibrio sp. TaxID=2212460 RepID=UPI00342E896C
MLRLECLLASHAASLNLPDEINVEHILPQTPAKTSQWIKNFTEEQRDQWGTADARSVTHWPQQRVVR